MSISSVCRRSVVTASATDSVLHAAQLMAERNVGTIVVVDASRHPVGILTDRDIAVRVVAEGRDPVKTRLEELMAQAVVTAREDEGFLYVLRRMSEAKVRRVLVVERDGALHGIVTLDDLLRQIGREMKEVAALVEAGSMPWPAPRSA